MPILNKVFILCPHFNLCDFFHADRAISMSIEHDSSTVFSLIALSNLESIVRSLHRCLRGLFLFLLNHGHFSCHFSTTGLIHHHIRCVSLSHPSSLLLPWIRKTSLVLLLLTHLSVDYSLFDISYFLQIPSPLTAALFPAYLGPAL